MNLSAVRKSAKNSGIKIQTLADSIGVNRSVLSRFINGKGGLNDERLASLIKVLNISAEALKKKAS